MSSSLRKVNVLELVAQASDALQHALEPTQELVGEVPDGAFKESMPEDWTPKEYQVEAGKLIKNLLNVFKSDEAVDAPVDYETLGKDNILLQAVNAVNTLAQGQAEYYDLCKQQIIDLDKEMERLKMLTAAIEAREELGDELGDLGRRKEITLEEQYKVDSYIKKKNRECQADLAKLIDELSGDDSDRMKEFLAQLFKKTFVQQGDPYIDVTSENLKLVIQLRIFNIVEDHPHDANKVKLISPN